MTVSMHKISAGDGYLYLVRQVAASDATHRGRSTLAEYYSVKGEAPGRWLGKGLAALSDPGMGRQLSGATVDEIWTVAEGSEVTEDQMKALFGEGLHPNATKITEYLTARGLGEQPATKAARLGGKFKIYEDPPFVKALAEAYRKYNTLTGQAPSAKLDPEVKSAIKTRLARNWFAEEYGRPAADDRELSGYVARINRPAKVAVAAIDCACSPVKSVSAAWALAPLQIAQMIEDCHNDSVADVFNFFETSAALTRRGANGVAQVDTEGLIATTWTHRDSRAGDPDLHTHLVLSAKVSTVDENGIRRWLALDAQPLHHLMVAGSELYNTRLEHYITSRLGWVFAETAPAGRGKRPVREIVGIPQELIEMWSSRRKEIEARTAELAKEFQNDHGREPTALELLALSQQATLETREAKHEPMSLAEQRAKWKTQAVELMGHRGLTQMLQEVSNTKASKSAALSLSDEHVKELLGEGLDINVATRAKYLNGSGLGPEAAASEVIRSGKKIRLFDDPEFVKALGQAYRKASQSRTSKLSDTQKKAIKTQLAREWFDDKYGSAAVETTALTKGKVSAEWISEAAEMVVAVVSASRARWQRHHLLAEAQRYLRITGNAAHHDRTLAERITDAALAEPFSVPHARAEINEQGEPVQLRRADGSSVYHRFGSEQFTSQKMRDAEQRIMAAARATGSRRAGRDDIEMALQDSAARDKKLNAGQTALVEEMAAGNRRIVLALAPAGSGKTTAMAALSHAWRSSGGNVIGLAPNAAAAIELSGDLNAPTDTVSKYVHTAAARPGAVPSWFRQINAKTMIIIDEVGKAGTLDLDAVISHAMAKGACVRLVGDDGQLASISAGGVLRDIAAETDALTLSELVRFHSESEAAATLALRAGDPAGLGYYIDHHRVHVGADTTADDMAYTAWRTDMKAGRDSLLLAPTNDVVDKLNARARRDRLADEGVTRIGREVTLSDGLAASVGDIVKTRKNSRWLLIGRNGDFVRNGYRYTINRVRGDGSLMVTHLGSGKKLTLPADYVKENVTLGYASTVDLAQGLTAKFACHIVGAANLTRQLLYVALTRGRAENHIYLSTAEQDPHRILSTKATHPETAVEALSVALARDGAQVSATTAEREARDPFLLLAPAADMYYDAICSLTEFHLGAKAVTQLEEGAEAICPAVIDCPAWAALRNKLLVTALDLQSVSETLQLFENEVNRRELDSADLVAAVMHWRMERVHPEPPGPLRWLSSIPQGLQANPEWASYLQRRYDLVSALAKQVRHTCSSWTITTAPVWAKAILAADRGLATEIAVFRAAHAVEDTDTRLTGPRATSVRAQKIQRLLEDRAIQAIGAASPELAQFDKVVDALNPRIRADGYWPQLAARLTQAAKIRHDIPALLASAAQEGPLPDELPAAALWWRIAPALSRSASILETTHSHLRPTWMSDLHEVFGSAAAEAITADPAWPALVSAIATTDPAHWSPRDLLHLAAEHIADADHDQPHRISVHEYARLITYSIELITAAAEHHTLIPHPEHPPLSQEEEELAPPDPESHEYGYPLGEQQTLFSPDELTIEDPYLAGDVFEPPPDPRGLGSIDEFDGLQFHELTTTRPVPDLKPALANVHALRNEYARAAGEYDELSKKLRIGSGPLINQNSALIGDMRARADADRPYLFAVSEVYSQWADADAAYDQATSKVAAAKAHYETLCASADPDPRAVETARLWIVVCERAVPAISPAEQFWPQIQAARAARAEAAGGEDKIISSEDVDAYLFELRKQEAADKNVKRAALRELRQDLEAAEAAAARAYADAETRSAEHIIENKQLLDTELRVLAACTRFDTGRPLSLDPDLVEGLSWSAQSALPRLAHLPFTVAPVQAVAGRDTARAMQALRAAANTGDRKVLWCSPTEEQAASARADGLADTATTVENTHQRITGERWSLPAGSLLVVDDPAAVAPEVLAALIEHAYTAHAGVILLQTSTQTWPPQPSTRLMTLLHHDLPWSTVLNSETAIGRYTRPPDLDPILEQAARVDPEVLDPDVRAALQRREKLREANRYAYQRHRAVTAFHDKTSSADEDLYPDLPDLS